jgi:N utilization substance protein A
MSRKQAEEIKPLNVKPLLKQISKEKELEPIVIKQAIESAILNAALRRATMFKEPRPELDIDSGDMRLYVKKKIVIKVADPRTEIDIIEAKKRNPDNMLGKEIEVEISPEEFGRIAAQSVRQGILQRLRDAERLRVYTDFKDRIGSVVTGLVQRNERRDVVVALGKVEALLPAQEIPMGVRHRQGDRVRVLIIDVRKSSTGPQIIVSRTRTELVRQLFSMEVPEISDGTVRIVEIAREPGVRTKIAVNSMNPDVDPVGACVGPKGARVQMIVRELDNEKIDIVPWSMNPDYFIRSALNPAKIVSIRLNEIEKRAEVIVERDSLSKAIGKRGTNAKLAAKLTGWKIDVRAQESAETLAQMNEIGLKYLEDFLSQIEGLPGIAREAIARSSEFNSVEKLAEAEPRNLLNFTNDNLELADEIVEGAKEYLEELYKLANSRGMTDTQSIAATVRQAELLARQLASGDMSGTVSFGGAGDAAADEGEFGEGGFSASPEDLPEPPPPPDDFPELPPQPDEM